ncbi:hypothetical protein E2C01_019905 [Portunus trituberculatus]|uniref:Uncharacterized protein n=1 Tax=Portunus trituberculatus TaxID=210409 RepID=A0A5B7DZ67_PORTR|nr:hypothetical protein [Portunus trituberculatus]
MEHHNSEHDSAAALDWPQHFLTANEESPRIVQSSFKVWQWLVRIHHRLRLHSEVLSITSEWSVRHHQTHEAPGGRRQPRSPHTGIQPPTLPARPLLHSVLH